MELIYDCRFLKTIIENNNKEQSIAEKLGIRYNECDLRGHISPNGFFCDYCYRRFKYATPKLDEVIKERERLFLDPIHKLLIGEAKDKEIASQKLDDLFIGIGNLKKEVNLF